MKIYTKLGDKGETSLIGGKRVVKHHPRIEAYGTVDELIACIAVLRDQDLDIAHKDFLLSVQHILMDCTAILAAEEPNDMVLPKIKTNDIEILEKEIDNLETCLPVLKSFILPGGHLASSHCHMARAICRRAERTISFLNENVSVDEMLIKYINRLSDYLFVLSRKILFDKGIKEILWTV